MTTKEHLEQLKNLHKLVWDFRALAREYWPTPSPDDALRYAFTEAGEAMDALLREKRPNDKRNHDKDHDRLDEWADCAIMLITALPGDVDSFVWHPALLSIRDELMCLRIADIMVGPATVTVELTLSMIAKMPGMDLQARIVGRLRRIMHKHVPPYRWGAVEAVLEPYKAERAQV